VAAVLPYKATVTDDQCPSMQKFSKKGLLSERKLDFYPCHLPSDGTSLVSHASTGSTEHHIVFSPCTAHAGMCVFFTNKGEKKAGESMETRKKIGFFSSFRCICSDSRAELQSDFIPSRSSTFLVKFHYL
jgi:hypothetical protein